MLIGASAFLHVNLAKMHEEEVWQQIFNVRWSSRIGISIELRDLDEI